MLIFIDLLKWKCVIKLIFSIININYGKVGGVLFRWYVCVCIYKNYVLGIYNMWFFFCFMIIYYNIYKVINFLMLWDCIIKSEVKVVNVFFFYIIKFKYI